VASEYARELRQQGITAAKAGNKEEARNLLQQSIRLEPNNEAAWLWLASVARDAEERRFCLEKLLEINPNNETALKALGGMPADNSPIKRIGSEVRRKPPTEEVPAAKAKSSTGTTQQATNIPTAAPEKIAEAQKQIDSLILEATAPLPNTVKYVHKTRRRAGESDIVVYRFYLGAAALGVLAVFAVLFIILVTTNEDAAELVFGPSPTITRTPTNTWTPTPGVTPTPSQQPDPSYTPSPSVPTEVPFADIFNPPRPTPIYPALLDRAMSEAVAGLYRGDVDEVMPTLDAARELSEDTLFDPVPYYYQAMAHLQRGENNRALSLLEEAQERREEEMPTSRSAQAVIDAGLTQVYDALARQADNVGDPAGAAEYNQLMLERAEAAIDADQRIAAPHLVAARYFRQIGNDNEAIRILNEALTVPSLRGNADIYFEKALIYADQADLGEADYQAFLTLYVDPANEAAHLLRINIAFERDRYSQAVLLAQEYLLFYPGSRLGFQLLGDAHRLEGKDDLAIFAYSRGLASPDESDATFNNYVGRGQSYLRQRQYQAAQDDFTLALTMRAEPTVQLLRMEAAYYAGDYDTAIGDGGRLAGATGVPGWRVALLEGRALIDESPNSGGALDQALGLLETAVGAAPSAERGAAFEYIARAHLGLGELAAAREAIDTALAAGESAGRRFVRGMILEESGDRDGAILDYEWALTLSEIVPFAGQGDLEDRLAGLR
jgi:tetratricopeptide (TPR) repeat protein